jgi:hypothetical protein
MLTSFLIPAADSGSSCHAPNANASPGGNTPPPGEDPMLIDAETRVHTQVVKMCMLMTGTGMLNPVPYVHTFVKHMIAANPNAMLLSDDPAITSVNSPNEVPKNKKINHFAIVPQMIGNCRQYAFFLKYYSTKSLSQIKFENVPMMMWLKKSCIWIVPHLQLSMHMTNIGFIHGMHPTFTNRDMLKSKLTPYMETVEVQLLVESEFYYKNNVRLDTKVAKVQGSGLK